MNLKTLLDLIESGSDLDIKYTFVNGKESLIVNGKEMIAEYDESIHEEIKDYKDTLDVLDDCMFENGLDEIRDEYDIVTMDSLLNSEHLTADEAESVREFISYSKGVYRNLIEDKIDTLKNILYRFE